MILSDFECLECGEIFEQLCNSDDQTGVCLTCGAEAKRIITLGMVYLGNQDATWIKSVLDVVDKDSTKPHVKAFRENPNRENYKAWMKGEGIRPADHTDHGAPPVVRKPHVDRSRINEEVFRRFRERSRLEVR